MVHFSYVSCVVFVNGLTDFPTHKTTSPGAAIFSLHTLASPSGRNVNYNEKQLTRGGVGMGVGVGGI